MFYAIINARGDRFGVPVGNGPILRWLPIPCLFAGPRVAESILEKDYSVYLARMEKERIPERLYLERGHVVSFTMRELLPVKGMERAILKLEEAPVLAARPSL
jgi:hypothetical protein